MRCSSCGTENREEARFCDSCGAALATAPGSEEKGDQRPREGPVPPPPGSPTEIAGRYSVTGYLGQGGRKKVYLASDADSGRDVAVAVFDTEGAAAAIGARARREAQAMGKLA